MDLHTHLWVKNDTGLSNVFVNTTLNIFRDEQWHRLLDRFASYSHKISASAELISFYRAGATIVRHLLSECSLFVPLPNEGLCQLAGPPINDLKPTSAFVIASLSAAQPELGKRKPEQSEDDRPRKRAKIGGDPGPTRPPQVAP